MNENGTLWHHAGVIKIGHNRRVIELRKIRNSIGWSCAQRKCKLDDPQFRFLSTTDVFQDLIQP